MSAVLRHDGSCGVHQAISDKKQITPDFLHFRVVKIGRVPFRHDAPARQVDEDIQAEAHKLAIIDPTAAKRLRKSVQAALDVANEEAVRLCVTRL